MTTTWTAIDEDHLTGVAEDGYRFRLQYMSITAGGWHGLGQAPGMHPDRWDRIPGAYLSREEAQAAAETWARMHAVHERKSVPLHWIMEQRAGDMRLRAEGAESMSFYVIPRENSKRWGMAIISPDGRTLKASTLDTLPDALAAADAYDRRNR